MSLPFNSCCFQNYSPGCVSELVKQEEMHHYLYRGKGMKRAPKNEFYYPIKRSGYFNVKVNLEVRL